MRLMLENVMYDREVQTLIAEFLEKRAALTEREKAVLAHKIWLALPSESKKAWGMSYHNYMRGTFGGSEREWRERSDFVRAGDVLAPLWPRIDSGEMALGTAIRLYKQAQERAKKKHLTVADALTKEIRDYDALPVAHRLPSGHVVRKAGGGRNLPKPTEKKKGGRQPSQDTVEERAFWQKIREDFAAFVAPRLAGTDEIVFTRLWKEMEVDLNMVLDRMMRRIDREQRNARNARLVNEIATATVATLSFTKVVQACKTLQIPRPQQGRSVDMKVARRQFHLLAREYHPDTHAGDEKMRPLYETVVNAMEIIEEYNKQLEEK